VVIGSALNRKLIRDLVAMKSQAFAIALVVAAGVAMFVMYLSNFDSLRRTQRAYYDRQRFADVFASAKRVPQAVEPRIAAIPGVTAFETRVVATVTLDLDGLDEPAAGLLVSVPSDRRPQVNDLVLLQGRWVDASRPDDVIASEGFVTANRFTLGSQFGAVINGRLRRLTVAGIALSPEHVYSIRPGELVPDPRRFAILWMERRALASAFDMEGGFNDVALALAPGASVDEAILQLDRILEPYGGRGAIPRALQLSHWTLENELSQLQSFGFILPLIFLSVAAFILNVALSRALALQRPQIAALKALGYNNMAIGWHYLKWAIVIALAGVVIGLAAGAWFGQMIIELYNRFFRFPSLLYRLSIDVALGATLMTLVAAALGAMSAVRRAVRIPPAEAMRPEPPARFRRTAIEITALGRSLSAVTRMVLRNVARHPFRALASIVGIAFAAAILVVGFAFIDAMEQLIVTQFSVAERQDVTVSFVEPRSPDVQYALSALPGVMAVEPQRSVAVRLRAGHRHRTLAIIGVPPDLRLRRIVDRDGRAIRLPAAGLVLSERLADVLAVGPGDLVTVEVLEGERPVRRLVVNAVVDDVLGLSAYCDLAILHELLRETGVISGAAMMIDPAREAQLSSRLKLLPAVAGASFKRAVVQNFRDTLAANMNISILFNVVFAGIIAFGVVYNAARVSLSERNRELASLRVLGFTRAEISFILLGELALVTAAALPVGWALGYTMAIAIVQSLDSEVYRFPLIVSRQAIAWAFLTIIAAALVSGLSVRRKLDHLDLVAVLKIRE
jgi:putative ABC transport system permease protein